MIGRLSGLVDEITDERLILDVNGVGYLVRCSGRTLQNLPPNGEMVTLQIETHVREDQISLFGFTSVAERDWFNLLRAVQGVGVKVALSILGTVHLEELAAAVVAEDKTTFTRASGVGPKVAARIVAELKDKISDVFRDGADQLVTSAFAAGEGTETIISGAIPDAISALVNLGYTPVQAQGAVAAVQTQRLPSHPEMDTSDLIRLALKELAR